jgi:hypothetical protein
VPDSPKRSHVLDVQVDTLLVAPEAAGGDHAQLVAELSAVVDALNPLSEAHQRQVAALLRGYLVAMPE